MDRKNRISTSYPKCNGWKPSISIRQYVEDQKKCSTASTFLCILTKEQLISNGHTNNTAFLLTSERHLIRFSVELERNWICQV